MEALCANDIQRLEQSKEAESITLRRKNNLEAGIVCPHQPQQSSKPEAGWEVGRKATLLDCRGENSGLWDLSTGEKAHY